MYRTTAGCLDEETFRHAVAIFFDGADPFNEDSPEELHVSFMRVPGGFRATVQKIPVQGAPWPEESDSSASCSDLFRNVARLASMRVPNLPKAAATPPLSPPDPPPEPVLSQPLPAAYVPLETSPPPQPKPPPPMDLAISLSAAVLMTAGFSADVGPGAQISAGVRRDWFSMDLEVRGVFPSRALMRQPVDPTKPSYSREFDLSQITGLLVPCVHFATYFAGCGVAQAGVMIAQTPVETNLLRSFGFGPRFAFEYPFAESFAAFAFGEALFPPGTVGGALTGSNPSYSGPPPNVAWQQSVVSAFLGAGVSVRFK